MKPMARDWTDEQQILLSLDSQGQPLLPQVAVLADAGSGKTSVLVERVRRLSREKRILCVSFTEKSKADLQERLADLNHVEVYTIHGFCGKLVGEFGVQIGLSPLFRIIDEEEASELFMKSFEKVYRRRPPSSLEHAMPRFFELCEKAREKSGNCDVFDCGGNGESDLAQFVGEVLSEHATAKRNRNVLEYGDLEAFAVRLLARAEVTQTLRARYDHVFVDEFQDTSDIQSQLVQAIASKSGSLFVVGDVKQSIYRFRGADVGVFQRFIERLPERRRLSINFRSHPEVIEAVNLVCAPLIEGYHPMSAGKNEQSQSPLFEKNERVCRVTAENDADAIATVLKRLQVKGFQISDVVLLLRRMRGNERLFSDLASKGIAVSTTSSASASLDDGLGSLLNLWVWACEPWQKIRAVQVLTDFPWSAPENSSSQRFCGDLEASLKMLVSPLSKQPLLSCEQLLRELEKQFCLRENAGSSFEQFRVFILKHHSKGDLPSVLARRIDRLLSSGKPVGGFSLISPPANLAGTLRALTVHSAKGLEFPVVILADVKPRRTRGTPILVQGRTLWLLTRDEKGDLDKTDATIAKAIADETGAEIDESARLLYVAMTRAQEALFIVDRPESDQPKKASASNHSWAAWLKSAITNVKSHELLSASTDPGLNSSTGPIHAQTVGTLVPSAPEYRKARTGVTEFVKTQSGEPVQADQTQSVISGLVKQTAVSSASLGTAVHRLLETLDWNGLKQFAKQNQLNLRLFWSWLETEQAKRAMGDECKRSYPEFAFELKTQQHTLTGRIDRLVLFDDEAWVIDYKILGFQRSAADLLAEHGPQLAIYAEAVRKLTPHLKVRAFLIDVTGVTGQVCHEVLLRYSDKLLA